MGDVAQFDPSYDQALYPARAAAYKEFFAGGNSSTRRTTDRRQYRQSSISVVCIELSDKLGGPTTHGF